MARAAAFWSGVLLLGSTVQVQAQVTSTQQNPVVTFSTPGAHQVTLTVCNQGVCDTVTKTVMVLNPVPSIVSAVVGAATAEVGQLVSLSGSGLGQPPLTYTWRLFQGLTLVRQVSGGLGWLDTSGLDPGAYTVVLRISNGSGFADSLPAPLLLLPPATTDFYTVDPCRMLDTRTGPALQSGVTRLVSVGACGIPANARALAVNVTAISGTGSGSLALFPGNYPAPGMDTVNFRIGATVANNSIMPLSTDGTGTLAILATLQDNGLVHATVDVVGYFAP